MKCSDCIFFSYRPMGIRRVGFCAMHDCSADPEDDGACDDGEPIEEEGNK